MQIHQQQAGGRHLTPLQRDDILSGLEGSVAGPVSMTASCADPEAVAYEGEIASVLEDIGCAVTIDNATTKAAVQELPAGVELTIKERTVRPGHAYRIIDAFLRAGVILAAKINGKRRNNDTLYITVGRDHPK